MDFDNVYWDSTWMRKDDHYPPILAYGNNGAEAFDYFRGTYSHVITTALKLYWQQAVLRLHQRRWELLRRCKRPATDTARRLHSPQTAAACFRDLAKAGSLGWLLEKIRASYIMLIDQIIGAIRSIAEVDADGTPASATGGTRILVHNYDYAPVSGTGDFQPRREKVCLLVLFSTYSNILFLSAWRGKCQTFLSKTILNPTFLSKKLVSKTIKCSMPLSSFSMPI